MIKMYNIQITIIYKNGFEKKYYLQKDFNKEELNKIIKYFEQLMKIGGNDKGGVLKFSIANNKSVMINYNDISSIEVSHYEKYSNSSEINEENCFYGFEIDPSFINYGCE
jgi:hypothetical protein